MKVLKNNTKKIKLLILIAISVYCYNVLSVTSQTKEVVNGINERSDDLFYEGEIVQMEVNDHSSYFLTDLGEVYVFGINNHGQLGLGHRSESRYPVPIDSSRFDGKPISIAAGYRIGFVVTDKGNVYSFGQNNSGRLGIGKHYTELNYTTTPTKIDFEFSGKPIKVTAGEKSALLLTDDGSLYGFGHTKSDGALGFNDIVDADYISPEYAADAVNAVDGKIIDVELHSISTHLITDTGKLYAMGFSGSDGSLGVEIEGTFTATPTEVDTSGFDGTPIKVKSGTRHSLVLTDTNNVYAFGYNRQGQLGLGHYTSMKTPMHISGEFTDNVIDIHAGTFYSGLITKDGKLYTVGQGANGQIGTGQEGSFTISTWHENTTVFDGNPVKLAMFYTHSLLVTDTGHLYSFGVGSNGRLGLGDDIDTKYEPTKMTKGTNKVLLNDDVVSGGQRYQFTSDITIDMTDTTLVKSATLNGSSISSGHLISLSNAGLHYLKVIDVYENIFEAEISNDSEPPVINVDVNSISHEINTDFNLGNYSNCIVTDNSGETINCVLGEIDTTSLGEKTLEISATDLSGNTSTATIIVEIVDTTAPIININNSEIEHEINTPFVPPSCDVTDNSGENINCEFSTVDTSELGTVSLEVTAMDSSGNKSTKFIGVIIVDTTPPILNIDTSEIIHEINEPFINPSCSVTDNSGEVIECVFSSIDVKVTGEKTLWVSAIDSSGNETKISIKVRVVDTTPPIVIVDDELIQVEINGYLKVYPTCFVSDNSNEKLNCDFVPADYSKLGMTQKIVTATDSSGNTGYAYVPVEVLDTRAPVIQVDKSDIIIEVNSPSPVPSCVVTDNSKEEINCVIGVVDTKTTGTKILEISATDSSLNKTTKYINVIVINTTNPPVINVDSSMIEVEINESIDAYLPACNAVDIDGNVVDCVFGEVDTSTLGERVLTIRATDINNNTGTVEIVVNVVDTIAPQITVDTSDIIQEINVYFQKPYCTVLDNSGEDIKCVKSVVDITVLGEQDFIITATDSSGNESVVIIKVNIVDTTPPIILGDNSDKYVEINSVPPIFDCTVIDNSNEEIECVFSEIDLSILGLQVITATATDSSGNKTTEYANVYVVDTTMPVISVETNDILHKVDTPFENPICDVSDNSNEVITCEFSTIDVSILGEQTLKVTAYDSSGNKAKVTIKVLIMDMIPPTISIDDSDIIHEINTTFILPTCVAIDNSNRAINIECEFSDIDVSILGEQVLIVTATDSVGNTSTKKINVTIVDTIKPIINVDLKELYYKINSEISYPTCRVTDNSGELIACEFSEIDTTILGNQQLIISAVDSSLNETVKFIDVFIVEKLELDVSLNDEQVEDGMVYYYNTDVYLNYNDKGIVTADFENGHVFDVEGNYDITIKNQLSEEIAVELIIDKTKPTIYFNNEVVVNQDKVIFTEEVVLTFDDNYEIESSSYPYNEKFIEEGVYNVSVVDKAGNINNVELEIDFSEGNRMFDGVTVAVIVASLVGFVTVSSAGVLQLRKRKYKKNSKETI